MGPYPKRGEEDGDLINAGKEPVTLKKGGSFFSSSVSFSIIRGQHLDLTMVGSLQVDSEGSLASWQVPNKKMNGMGGAMDLVTSGSKVIVLMQHLNKGKLKILD